ncbi:MAG: NAD(P)H-quinone oxidoreductase [Chloroflexi bacterium]|nr:NAD(P)H-quinone oxidoreductase [Chloroflexota bacterium]
MYAVVITGPGGPEVLEVREVEDPVPGPEEVLVAVKAAGLNRGDIRRRQEGAFWMPPGARGDILGLEVAGVVAKVGEKVTGVPPGSRVFALLAGGGYAQRVAVHHRMLLPIPQNLEFWEAAAIPEAFFTAHDALFRRCALQLGERVLIHAVGSGGGSAALQLAHQAGAYTFGTAGSQEKLARAKVLGLDVGINYREQDFTRVVQEHTGGSGVDVVFDLVGAAYWEGNVACLRPLGRLVLVGNLSGGRWQADLGPLLQKRLQVHGTVLRTRSLDEKILLTQEFRRQILPLFERSVVRPVVDRVFPWREVADAHRYLDSNANFGKVVLAVD